MIFNEKSFEFCNIEPAYCPSLISEKIKPNDTQLFTQCVTARSLLAAIIDACCYATCVTCENVEDARD